MVEVDEEGTMDDEFRQEQQLEKAKKKIFIGKGYVKSDCSLSLSLSLSVYHKVTFLCM